MFAVIQACLCTGHVFHENKEANMEECLNVAGVNEDTMVHEVCFRDQ